MLAPTPPSAPEENRSRNKGKPDKQYRARLKVGLTASADGPAQGRNLEGRLFADRLESYRRAESLVAAGVSARLSHEVAVSDVLITIVRSARSRKSCGVPARTQRPGGASSWQHLYRFAPFPRLARKIAAACVDRQVAFLDAPVTGGTWGAEKGELVFMVGGDAQVLKDAEPVFSVMGKRWFHLGPNAAGQTIKLAMNLILALEVDALAEGLALVTAAGLQGEKLVEVLQSSMGRAAVLDVKAPLLLKGEYPPSFPLRLMHKDVGLALDLAREVGVTPPRRCPFHLFGQKSCRRRLTTPLS